MKNCDLSDTYYYKPWMTSTLRINPFLVDWLKSFGAKQQECFLLMGHCRTAKCSVTSILSIRTNIQKLISTSS